MITLNGPPPYTVRQGGTYADPGAIVTDLNNTSYTQDATASTLDTLPAVAEQYRLTLMMCPRLNSGILCVRGIVKISLDLQRRAE